LENGTFKAGIDYGYFDGGMFLIPKGMSARIHLINSRFRINGDVFTLPRWWQLFARMAEIIIRERNKESNGNTQIIRAGKKIESVNIAYLPAGSYHFVTMMGHKLVGRMTASTRG